MLLELPDRALLASSSNSDPVSANVGHSTPHPGRSPVGVAADHELVGESVNDHAR
jgi:hypothetical protein